MEKKKKKKKHVTETKTAFDEQFVSLLYTLFALLVYLHYFKIKTWLMQVSQLI